MLDSGALRVIAICLFMLVVVRRGWLCDDAFISLRYVDNLVHGYGLVFNPGDRVQGFTNPLWVLLLAIPHFFFREPYWVCLVLSLVVALAGVLVLAYGVARDASSGALAVFALTFTQAYTDFSTSGLENPLGHLLLAAFLALFLVPEWRIRHARWLWLLAGLLLLHRLDTLLFVAPPLVLLFRKLAWRRSLRFALVGFAPIIAWELFSLTYYGFLLPNTAIAKLNIDIPREELLGQGVIYLIDSLERDPLTGLLIACGVVAGFRSRDLARRLVAVGILMALAYVSWVAGDFMLGRFLSMPLIASVCLLASSFPEPLERAQALVAAGVLAVLVLVTPFNPFHENHGDKKVPKSGIANERDWYVEQTGVLANLRAQAYRSYSWFREGRQMAEQGKRAAIHCNAGMVGYGAGPSVQVVDLAGLTDAFLARLDYKYRADWRTAHWAREVPTGYLETLSEGKNLIVDPKLRQYYEKIHLVTAGPIFSLERLKTAWALSLGAYDSLLE